MPIENHTDLSRSATLGVVVPCFNCENTIERCLDSVIAQDEPAQIVVVNDGSTDGSARVLEKYRDAAIVTTENGGASRARNVGLERIDSDFVCFLDADDEFAEGALTTVHAALDGAGQIDMLVSNYFDVADGEARLSNRATNAARMGWVRAWARQENVIGQAIWFATAFARSIGGWTESVRVFQDYEFTLRAVISAKAIGLLEAPTVLYHHRPNANRISARRDAESVRSCFDCYLRTYEDAKQRLNEADVRALASGFLRWARLLYQAGDYRGGRLAYGVYREEGDPGALDAQDDLLMIRLLGLELRERLGRMKRRVLQKG